MRLVGYVVLGYVALAGLLAFAGWLSYQASVRMAEDRQRICRERRRATIARLGIEED